MPRQRWPWRTAGKLPPSQLQVAAFDVRKSQCTTLAANQRCQSSSCARVNRSPYERLRLQATMDSVRIPIPHNQARFGASGVGFASARSRAIGRFLSPFSSPAFVIRRVDAKRLTVADERSVQILDATPAGVGMLFRHGIGAQSVGETLLRCYNAQRTRRP